MTYFIPIFEIQHDTIPLVGRKSYGIKQLQNIGVPTVDKGIVLTTDFTYTYLQENGITPCSQQQLEERVLNGTFSQELSDVLHEVYTSFSGTPLAVRSSATFEDMEHASFGGQYRSHLNVRTFGQFCDAVKDCIASTYSARAHDYMTRLGVSPQQVGMAVLVQPLVEGQSSGIVLTVDPISECEGILQVTASYGLGEAVVSNTVDADTYTLLKSTGAILSRTLGEKKVVATSLECGGIELKTRNTNGFCLAEQTLQTLVAYGHTLESKLGVGQDYEFVVKSDGTVVVTQVRPQILHGTEKLEIRRVPGNYDFLISGIPIVQGASHGTLRTYDQSEGENEILFLDSVDVSSIPRLRTAQGLVIDRLAPGSHPALILRELGIPTISQPKDNITPLLEKRVTLDATTGAIYAGTLPIETSEVNLREIEKPKTQVHIACSSPQALYRLRRLLLDGIALMRSEFIINYDIGIHPLALLAYDTGNLDRHLRDEIQRRIAGYASAREYFVEKLASGIASITALLPDKPAKYRFCDFQSNDYRGLLGGELFEPQEENPMIGLRGVTRLLTPRFQPAFDLELEAVQRVRDMGLTSLELLFGFCRTPEDGEHVRAYVHAAGIKDVKIGMMAEVPSNYLQADEFADVFDFFLVGPRDLTQTAYAADRTSPELARYTPAGKAPMKAVMTLLRNLEGKEKEVYIGSYLLFQHLPEYLQVSSNNKLHFAELPDNIIDGMKRLVALEKRL
jgi:pyruvate,water dikinase